MRPYAEVLAEARRRADKAEAVARANGRSAIVYARAAGERLRLQRLTGGLEELERAETLLREAFALDTTTPPYMLRARLHYALHRLAPAAEDLAAARRLPTASPAQRASMDLLAADLAFQAGRYDEALAGYEAAVSADPGPAALASLARYRFRTGAFDEAEALYERTLRLHEDPEPLAWTHLQLGLMDLERGRDRDALAHYRDAERILPGYWLVEEHIAEVLARSGEATEAKAMYRELVERTQNPELMDALARLLLDSGDGAEARVLIERAGAAYDAQMVAYPEAMVGHALEHALQFGEPEQAVALAERNHRLRPNAEAEIALARAYLSANRTADARRVTEHMLASPIRMASLHATAASVLHASGEHETAREQEALASALDPVIGRPAG